MSEEIPFRETVLGGPHRKLTSADWERLLNKAKVLSRKKNATPRQKRAAMLAIRVAEAALKNGAT
ncbi:MAG: hypothetical protein AAGF74_17575 [Pseudomonadota bacterium]